MSKNFKEIKVVTHNPDYMIVQGTFIKENGEEAQLTHYEKIGAPELWGYEYYSGENYIVGSSEKSYSRNYVRGNGLPTKYKKMAFELMNVIATIDE